MGAEGGRVQSVALVFQPMLAKARQLAAQCGKIVEAEGYQPRLLSAWELGSSASTSGLHLAMTFGGDGTIIRSARWLAGTNVPILGVAMGRLGFLTELPPENACEKLPSVLAGSYWRDERLMLSARVHARPETGDGEGDALSGRGDVAVSEELLALNEVVVARGASPRVLHIEVAVNGVHLARYVADGLIVSTPTGSTAYALSAGGPVIAPEVDAILVVPVAAHLTALRSLVVPASAQIEVRASSEQPSLLVLDGQMQVPLRNHQPVTVQVARERTVFARMGSRSRFFESLVASLTKG